MTLAEGGLFRNLPFAQEEQFRKWARDEYRRDPEQPIKQVWHPVVRFEFGLCVLENALTDLHVVRRQPLDPVPEEHLMGHVDPGEESQ